MGVPDRRIAPPGALELLLLAVFFSLVAFHAAHPFFAVDLFWHLQTGRVIAEQGRIPNQDLFSAVHPESAWVSFYWLWEFLAYGVVERFGLRGLRVAQSLLMVLSFAILYLSARRIIRVPGYAAALCCLVLVLFADRFRARPDSTSLLFVAAMLPALTGGFRRTRGRELFWSFLVALLWSNVHGGTCSLLLASAGALTAGATLNRLLRLGPAAGGESEPLARVWLWGGVVVLGLGLSPTTITGWIHFSRVLGPMVQSGHAGDWEAAYTMLGQGLHPSFIIVGLGPSAVGLIYLVERLRAVRFEGRQAVDLAELFVCGGYLLLSHLSIRNAFLCFVPLVFVLKRFSLSEAARRSPSRLVGHAAALVLLAVNFHYLVIEAYTGAHRFLPVFARDLAPGAFPEHAARFLREAGIEGKLISEIGWGGYLEWHLWPRCHLFADTRQNLTPEMRELVEQTFNPLSRPRAMQAAADRWGIELALFNGPTFPLHLPGPGWELLYKAGPEEVYQRSGGEHAEENRRLAARYLRDRGISLPERPGPARLRRAAIEVGARDWLLDTQRVWRQRRAWQDLRSPDERKRLRARKTRGYSMYLTGNYRAAISDLEAVARVDPRDATVRYRLAVCYFLTGRFGEAESSMKQLQALGAAGLRFKERAAAAALARHLSRTAR